jgi:hypothetical protein
MTGPAVGLTARFAKTVLPTANLPVSGQLVSKRGLQRLPPNLSVERLSVTIKRDQASISAHAQA